MSASPKISLNLLVIRAENPERLCRFYSALGLTFVREQHGSGSIHYACEIGDSVFEIYPRKSNAPKTTATRLGFNVLSIDDALEALKGEDAAIVSGPSTTAQGARVVVRDPEGHTVELIQPHRQPT